MDQIVSWHGNDELKQEAFLSAYFHRRYGRLIRGNYWNGYQGNAIGCHAHHLDPDLVPSPLGNWANQYRIVSQGYGWPMWLITLEDWLFENGTFEKAIKLPEALCKAVPVGVDLTPVFYKMLDEFLLAFGSQALPSTTWVVYNDLRVLTSEGIRGLAPRTAEWARCKRNAHQNHVDQVKVHEYCDPSGVVVTARVVQLVAEAGASGDITPITQGLDDWDTDLQELADRIGDKLLSWRGLGIVSPTKTAVCTET